MTRAEAIKMMVEGKFVKHYDWPKGDYIHLSDEGYFINASGITIDIRYLHSAGWTEALQPPKKTKVTFYRRKWLLCRCLDTDCGWFKSIEEFDAYYGFAESKSDEIETKEIEI
jgi:hypothetical protein